MNIEVNDMLLTEREWLILNVYRVNFPVVAKFATVAADQNLWRISIFGRAKNAAFWRGTVMTSR